MDFFGELLDDRKDVELSLEQQNSAALVAYLKLGGGGGLPLITSNPWEKLFLKSCIFT